MADYQRPTGVLQSAGQGSKCTGRGRAGCDRRDGTSDADRRLDLARGDECRGGANDAENQWERRGRGGVCGFGTAVLPNSLAVSAGRIWREGGGRYRACSHAAGALPVGNSGSVAADSAVERPALARRDPPQNGLSCRRHLGGDRRRGQRYRGDVPGYFWT